MFERTEPFLHASPLHLISGGRQYGFVKKPPLAQALTEAPRRE
jgi:hypothetical protein